MATPRGDVRPPGDKSITHRALVLGALGEGRTELTGVLTSLDARSMARVLRQLGVRVSALRPGARVVVQGRGLGGLRRPRAALDCGNSGTSARFMLGTLAGFPFAARITGDASLRRRPMRRVTAPLAQMGARFEEKNGDGLPLVVHGGRLRALHYQLPVAAAQVKSALLLGGLTGGVVVQLSEPAQSRDHTERMLQALGVRLTVNGLTVSLEPPERLAAFELAIPGDISSAAFLIGAALLGGRGELVLREVGVNPTRVGSLRVLERMGAAIAVQHPRPVLGEPVADIVVNPSALRACTVEPDEVPSLIDEIPMLAVLAARAEGESVFRGVQELRVKESDRLMLIARNLRAVGTQAEASGDTLTVVGTDRPPRGEVDTAHDHRLAMAFAVLGSIPGAAVRLSERASVVVSYPGFFDDLKRVRAGV